MRHFWAVSMLRGFVLPPVPSICPNFGRVAFGAGLPIGHAWLIYPPLRDEQASGGAPPHPKLADSSHNPSPDESVQPCQMT